jgi:hypothetical protein
MAYFLNTDRYGSEILNGGGPDFKPTPVNYTPTASGNSTDLNSFVIDPNGDIYFIDEQGDAFKVNTTQAVTTITGAKPTGNTIGTFTNEIGAVVDIKETITMVSEFSITGNVITFKYIDEAGVTTEKSVTLPAAEPEFITSISGALENGNIIGTYTNELNAKVDIKETITSVSELSIAGNVITLKYVDEAGVVNEKTVTLPAATAETVTTLTDALAAGNKIGTYTNESGTAVTINETITSIGTVTYDTATGILTIPYVDEAGVTNNKTVTIPPAAPFKNLNEWHVDPNGDDATGTGAQEKPYKTIAKALTSAGQGDQVIVHAGTYTENVTISTPNVALVGAQSEYGPLTQINGSITVSHFGTSVKIADLLATSVNHTGTSPLYLENVTLTSTFTSSSSAYVEIRNSSIQDGAITKSAGSINIEQSKIDNVSITGANTSGIIRNSYQEGNSTITYGAGTVYGVFNVQGGEIVIDPTAIPLESAALAQGLTAEMAKEAETSDFMKLGMLRPDAEASPTKYVTWDEVTGRLEVSPAPTTGGASAIWISAETDPTAVGNTGLLPRFVDQTTNGTKWYVDSNGVAFIIEGVSEGCGNVFFDAENPVDAATFDTENPPITNDPALRNLDCATYISAIDGSVWSSDGTTYKTKTYSYPLHQRHVITATANQTSFTMPKTPIGDTEKVHVSRNGVDISRAFTWVGGVGTYNSANNYNCVIDAGDILQFHYEAL